LGIALQRVATKIVHIASSRRLIPNSAFRIPQFSERSHAKPPSPQRVFTGSILNPRFSILGSAFRAGAYSEEL
jgi:hypothetical protein